MLFGRILSANVIINMSSGLIRLIETTRIIYDFFSFVFSFIIFCLDYNRQVGAKVMINDHNCIDTKFMVYEVLFLFQESLINESAITHFINECTYKN